MQNSHNNVQKMEFTEDDDPTNFNGDSATETSSDDVDYNVEMETDSNQDCQYNDEDFQYEVLSPSEISEAMLNLISEVNTVLQIPIPTTKTLLAYFKWDKEKLLDRFFDGDQEKIFTDSHILNPLRRDHKSKSKIPQKARVEVCEICFDSVNPKHMTGVGCEHKFCYNCWNEYLTTQIIDEGAAETIACAGHNCPILMDDETVLQLVRDSKVKSRYQQVIVNNFVLCNKQMRWCPSPDCSLAIRVSYVDSRPVVCSCGHIFCFACGESWHDPVKCALLKKWMKKCDDDSETSNWISVNTKECPKCFATIEKDGGCNHMICKNQSCKADFCWVCLGSWEPHGSSWYTCNKFDEEEAQKARNAHEKSRAALQRYLFYCNRYMNHMQSLKFENKLYSSVKVKMEEMQHHNMSWIEVQFLKKAVDILCKCRQTLMYTYVFAYYLKKNNQSVIFEENQKDLERTTELLSEYLERDITQENLVNIKQKVQDKCQYCDVRRKVLLDHVHEGYEKEWWTYND